MRTYLLSICVYSILYFTTAAQAEDGYQLWLRNSGPRPVKVESSKKSLLINNAIRELQSGWMGTANATVRLNLAKDKALKEDGFRISPNTVSTNTERACYMVYSNFFVGRKIA